MVKTISTEEARTKFDDVLAAVKSPNGAVVVVQNGKPVAAILNAEDYERYRQERIERGWATIDRIRERNAHLDPDEVLREVTETVEEVRREMYEEKQRAAAGRR
ncbi:MAG TPA: type II toxin-antitoxin system prevent-host-death family antitoxin [Thermomicrobiales bacterium]|jgi:prevent-host-death family protein